MTRYISLGEHFWLAEQVTGVDADVLVKVSRPDLADSALHAPQAGFGKEEFYPDLHDKAAVLLCRLSSEPSVTRREQEGDVGCARHVHRAELGYLDAGSS